MDNSISISILHLATKSIYLLSTVAHCLFQLANGRGQREALTSVSLFCSSFSFSFMASRKQNESRVVVGGRHATKVLIIEINFDLFVVQLHRQIKNYTQTICEYPCKKPKLKPNPKSVPALASGSDCANKNAFQLHAETQQHAKKVQKAGRRGVGECWGTCGSWGSCSSWVNWSLAIWPNGNCCKIWTTNFCLVLLQQQ